VSFPDDVNSSMPGAGNAEASPSAEAAIEQTPEEKERELNERIARLQAERDDLVSALQRLQADFDNARKRMARERLEDSHRFTAQFIEHLLSVLDSFERSFSTDAAPEHAAARRGYELIYRELFEVLARNGLTRIPAEGHRFDPHVHQAVERVETSDVEDGTIIGELRSGYRVRDRVLRPSLVRVAVAPAGVAREPDVN
jgi:molecular chaperone GrpE